MATALLVRRIAGLSVSGCSRSTISSTSLLVSQPCVSSASTSSTVSLCRRPLASSLHVCQDALFTAQSRSFSSSLTQPRKTKRSSSPMIMTEKDGRQYAVVHTSRRKLKPSIVRRRLERMKTYIGNERDIRYSPFKLNLICRLVAGLPLPDALTQLEFCIKDKAPLVQKVLKRTSNLADIRDGLQPSQLEVAECFATQGHHIKGFRPMGRGRTGKTKKRFSHLRVILREIDFALRIYQAPNMNQKRKWIERQVQAEKDAQAAQADREELERLEQEAAANEKEATTTSGG